MMLHANRPARRPVPARYDRPTEFKLSMSPKTSSGPVPAWKTIVLLATIESLIMFIRQNEGTLAKNRRKDEFDKLTDEEVKMAEAIVREVFEGFSET